VKIKFLGTGSVHGMPIWNCDCDVCKSKDKKDKRLRSALFVQIGETNIAIDFGPDFRTQLMRNNITKLDYVFLTHVHGDHFNGYMVLARQKNLIVEMPEAVQKEFFDRLGGSKAWLKKRNPTIKFNVFEKKKIGNVTIETVALKHQKDYEKEYMPCYGYIFRSKNFSFAYMSDYNEVLEPEKLKKLDLIISDGNGMKNLGNGHAAVDGSIEIFNKFKPKQMLLTHIKHTKSHKFMSDFVRKFGNIYIAYDGMEIVK
jgi:phosphoribosyl 1,2-cyclic phosphate phosphodiesterase